MMRLVLPYPPTANLYWRVFRGRPVKSADARQYQDNVRILARQQGVRGPPTEADVSLVLKVFRPQRRGDLDNAQKVLIDALKGVAFVDDSQVVEIHAFRRDDKTNPRVELEMLEVGR